jgi:hypothetical protein
MLLLFVNVCNQCSDNPSRFWQQIDNDHFVRNKSEQTKSKAFIGFPFGLFKVTWNNSSCFCKQKYYLNDNILRTLGAAGISINRDVAKNEMRRLASKFDGISATCSFVLSKR